MRTETESQLDLSKVPGRLDIATRALRGLGAAMLLASASTFLVQRWDEGNDLLRFGFLLCHSLVLLGAAYFCGGRLGETRSARLFLWTSLAIIPVHFGVLGGLLYSVFAWDAPEQLLPAYAVWQAPSAGSAVFALLVALLVVVPTCYVGARVLVRKRATEVSVGLLFLSSLLIVPVRGADFAGVLSLIGAMGGLFLERRRFAGDYAMRTMEGRLVRAALWTPIVMLAGRTVVYYPTTTLFLGLLVLAAGLCTTVVARGLDDNTPALSVTEWIGSLVVALGAALTVDGMTSFRNHGMLLLLVAPLALLACSVVNRSAKDGLEKLAAHVAFSVCALCMMVNGTLLDGAVAIVVGALALGHSIVLGRPVVGALSGLLTLGGGCLVFERAIGFESLTNWGTLSFLGLSVVVASAYVERHKAAITGWAASRLSAVRSTRATSEGALSTTGASQ